MTFSSVSGSRWAPHGTTTEWGCPDVGAVVALDHEVWRVVEVRPLPPESWRDEDRWAGPGKQQVVRLRPVRLASHPDPVKAASEDVHYGSLHVKPWRVFPDPEHYPLCHCCGTPSPCRIEVGREVAEQAVQLMGRYEMPGVCPACEQPVTQRQKAIMFADNLKVPGGPAVTFHLRANCRYAAMKYEQAWAKQDPTRRCHLSCDGHLTNHNDGTYDCTALNDCPGPTAHHQSYSVCRCPDCHAKPWTYGGGCRPDPKATRNAGEPS